MQTTDTDRDRAPAADAGGDAVLYRRLLETLSDGILIVDAAGVVIDLNTRAAELMNVGVDAARKRRLEELAPANNSGGPVVAKALEALQKGSEFRVVLAVAAGEGKTTPLNAVVRRLRGGDGLCFFLNPGGSGAAPSEEVATALGKVSHDLENLLTPLYSYPDLIRKDLPAGSRAARLLDVMEKTAKDMGAITQRLVAISKSGRAKTQVFSINGPVRKVAELMAHDAESKNIKLQLALADDLLSVKGTPEQFLRVVQNLCKNAIDAIAESGRIDLETTNVYIDRTSRAPAELKMGEYVRLRVSDTGPGIPDEIREKMFDSFFTTKGDRGKGSGLGLSVVKDIVTEHQGIIEVSSRAGQGTTFELHFPVCRRDVPTGTSSRSDTEASQAVAVADDDPAQRDIITKLLSYHGYGVTCFPDGEHLVEYFVEHGALQQQGGGRPLEGIFPEVVFLDEEMGPGMDGKTACARILEVNPKQQVIMLSARDMPDGVKADTASGTVTYLRKPLTWVKIEAALRILACSGRQEQEDDGNLVPCASGRVLIVDDEEGICRLFDMILSAAFPLARLESCGTGEDAVELYRRNHHAVILMDLHMVGMDGHTAFTTIQEISGKNGWKMPSVIFCTGFAPPAVIKRIVNSNANHGLLTKPVSGEDLIRAVKKRISF